MESKTADRTLIIAVVIFIIVIAVILYLVINKKNPIMTAIKNKVWDAASEKKIETLHPAVRPKATELINLAEKEGIKLRVTSGLRTWEEQAALYAQGRTAPGSIVTNAKPGDSFHNYGTAFDVVPIVDGSPDWNSNEWDKIGSLGKSLGFKWGGDFSSIKDRPHFEMNFGKTLAQLKSRYNAGDLQGGYVNIT
jgi:peptidoglycan L-alanyl-D-glutamate endopeptidase CwlK